MGSFSALPSFIAGRTFPTVAFRDPLAISAKRKRNKERTEAKKRKGQLLLQNGQISVHRVQHSKMHLLSQEDVGRCALIKKKYSLEELLKMAHFHQNCATLGEIVKVFSLKIDLFEPIICFKK